MALDKGTGIVVVRLGITFVAQGFFPGTAEVGTRQGSQIVAFVQRIAHALAHHRVALAGIGRSRTA